MTEYNDSLSFPQSSGVVEALQNDLKLKASTSGHVFVGGDNPLRPEIDLKQDLGLDFLRWATVHAGNINATRVAATSGVFNTLFVDGVATSGDPARQRTFYVGKHGDDNNDGMHPDRPFFTFDMALDTIGAIPATREFPYTIICEDTGIYEPDIFLDMGPFITIVAPSATMSGSIIAGDDTDTNFRQIILTDQSIVSFGFARGSSSFATVKEGGVSKLQLRELRVEDQEGLGIIGGFSTTEIDIETVVVTSGIGVRANTRADLVLDIQDIYLHGDPAIGKTVGPRALVALKSTNIVGSIGRVLGREDGLKPSSESVTLETEGGECSGFLFIGINDTGYLYKVNSSPASTSIRIIGHELLGSGVADDSADICIRQTCDIGVDPDGVRIYYVGKHGNDGTNDGQHPDRPFLTFTAANNAIVTHSSSDTSDELRYTIVCHDAGLYDETPGIDVLPFVSFYAPNATFSGFMTVGDNTDITFGRLINPGDTTPCIWRTSSGNSLATTSGVTRVYAKSMKVHGSADANRQGIRADGPGQIEAHVGRVEVERGTAFTALNLFHPAKINLDVDEIILKSTIDSRATAMIVFADGGIIGRIGRVTGNKESNTALLDARGSTNGSGYLFINESNVDYLYKLDGSTGFDLRIYGHELTGSGVPGTDSNICIVRTCNLLDGSFTPVDARDASGSIVPDTADIYNLGSAAFPWARVDGASGIFNDAAHFGGEVNFNSLSERPTVHGSGIAIRNEQIMLERTFFLDFGAGRTSAATSQDGLSTNPYVLVFPDRVKIHPRYSVLSQHNHGSTPTEWYILVVKRRPDQTRSDVASGLFAWDNTVGFNRVTVGSLDIDSSEAEFDPGDGIEVWGHNDGSGTAVDTVLLRPTIGFTPNTPSSGIGV